MFLRLMVTREDGVDGGDDEEGEEAGEEEAADDGDTEGLAGAGGGAEREGYGENAEDGGEAGHQDRAEAGDRGFEDRLNFREALFLPLVRELDDEDAVLGDEADEHDDADLAEDVQSLPGEMERE